ncbi:DUF1850 domain-containing protein [Azorhizobium doebereinerae]|uniref:DUF1850 domain-containing protein n=1 Tax=Azorhizobium doebereinerae TaxID=281091 RepID=UPI00042520DB|nr:DUF1850 domain-containing protein [Azorhizobium doebereinerae]
MDPSLLICLSGAGTTVKLALAFTLAWTHSVQKTSWEEDWLATPQGLVITEMRIEGSGAGMEPPEDAVRLDGRYVAHPHIAPLAEVVLRRSNATADYRICLDGTCRPMGELVPPDADPVTLTLCSEQDQP